MSSCEKEELTNDLNSDGVSNATSNQPGEFKRDIILNDESGKNSLFISIYSDFESAIDEYLSITDLKLVTNKEKFAELITNEPNINNNLEKNDSKTPEIDEEHSVVVEVISVNLETCVESYSIEINSKMNKSTNFISGVYAYYKNSSDFAGIVHKGTGYWLYASTNFKANWYNVSFSQVWSGYLDPVNSYYKYVQANDSYKTAIGVYLDSRQQSINYAVKFSKDNYYGHECEIGTYGYTNYGECYVGSSPVGTTAFIYANNFYYTYASGSNKCPIAGSWDDNANCFYMDIPVGCEAYTWQRNWLVKSNKLAK